MKNTEIIITGAQFKILTGLEVPKKAKPINEAKVKKYQLSHLIEVTPPAKSIDERFDNKNIIQMLIDDITENGLKGRLKERVLLDKANIKKMDLVGPYSFLNDLIPEEQKKRMIKILTQKNQYHKTHGW